MIKQYLDDLENRLDPEIEENLDAEWRRFLAGECPDPVFHPKRGRKAPLDKTIDKTSRFPLFLY